MMPATRCRSWPAFCHLAALIMAASAFAGPDVMTRPVEVREEPSPKAPVTGPRLRQTLDLPVAGLTWRDVPLRDALREAGDAFSLAIVRDRRIDPTRLIELEVANVPL